MWPFRGLTDRAPRRRPHLSGVRLFPSMTALENVQVGRFCRTMAASSQHFVDPVRPTATEAATRRRAEELLARIGLTKQSHMWLESSHSPINSGLKWRGHLPLIRDCCCSMSLGLDPVEVQQAGRLFLSLKNDGTSLLITERRVRLGHGDFRLITVMNYSRRSPKVLPIRSA